MVNRGGRGSGNWDEEGEPWPHVGGMGGWGNWKCDIIIQNSGKIPPKAMNHDLLLIRKRERVIKGVKGEGGGDGG